MKVRDISTEQTVQDIKTTTPKGTRMVTVTVALGKPGLGTANRLYVERLGRHQAEVAWETVWGVIPWDIAMISAIYCSAYCVYTLSVEPA